MLFNSRRATLDPTLPCAIVMVIKDSGFAAISRGQEALALPTATPL